MEKQLKPPKRAHLICGNPVVGIAAFLLCSYFAYSSFADLRSGDVFWQAGWWITLTWAVWLVFAAGIMSETRCWRERIFFGCVLAACAIGLVFSAWTSAQSSAALRAREASLAFWSLAALASLATLPRPAQPQN